MKRLKYRFWSRYWRFVAVDTVDDSAHVDIKQVQIRAHLFGAECCCKIVFLSAVVFFFLLKTLMNRENPAQLITVKYCSAQVKGVRCFQRLSVMKTSLERMNLARNCPNWHRQRGSASSILMSARCWLAIGSAPQIPNLCTVFSKNAAEGQKARKKTIIHWPKSLAISTRTKQASQPARDEVNRTFTRLGWNAAGRPTRNAGRKTTELTSG